MSRFPLEPADEPQSIPGSAVPVLYGPGSARLVGCYASTFGRHALLVSDPGLERAGHVDHVARNLRDAGLHVTVFTGTRENPTTQHVDAGVALAREARIDLIVGLGGGSAMDCAKGINFIYTNGGHMRDYWGVGKAPREMLPFVAIPTTTGTGSEAQSAALIADPETHQKMACLDRKTLARLAVLDVELALTQPARVAAFTGIDAISHAVETAASTKRNDVSRQLSRAAWELLADSYLPLMQNTADRTACSRMQLGAHFAGAAIENAMLGAAHACANPLTATYGIVHGAAVGLMLPWVIRFNTSDGYNPYADLGDGETLARQVEQMLAAAGLPRRLSEHKVDPDTLPALAASAAKQWTAQFNPRPVNVQDLLALYRRAL